MSTPISSITRTASGLTWVASVPALCGSKRSPPRWRSRASAIWLLAELWVHRNRTLARSPTSAATGHAPPLGSREQAVRALAEQPAILELLHVIGDFRLAHAELVLELADADALLPLDSRDARIREVAAAAPLGHHGEHPHPYGVRKGTAQGNEPIHTLILGFPAGAVLLHDPEFPGAHDTPPTGLRPRMKALASGTSVAAVSPQQPEPPQHPEASTNSSA